MTKKKDNNYYVYVHRKKTNGEVFYVGKGKGDRAWQVKSRNKFWKHVVDKHGYHVELVLIDVLEWYAFEVESELILKYGRRDINTGSLVNLSDGGEGPSGAVYSEARRAHASIRFSGIKNPKYIDKIHTFRNIHSNLEYTGTFHSFNIDVGFKFSASFNSSKCKITRGWFIVEDLSDEELLAIKSNYSGEYCKNPRQDRNVYSFTNLVTMQILKHTRYEMDDLGFNIKALFLSKPYLVTNGWCLSKSIDEYGVKFLLSPNSGLRGTADTNIYDFVNRKEGLHFSGRRFEFKEKFGIETEKLFYTVPRKSCKGWSLVK